MYDVGPLAGKPVPGMLKVGNIDVNHRPSIKNDDGSSSSIFSVTVPLAKDGSPRKWGAKDITQYALVPSIVNGKFLTPDGKMPKEGDKRALGALEDKAAEYYGKTRQHLGIFATGDDAEKYAGQTHAWTNDGTARKVYTPSYDGESNIAPPKNTSPRKNQMPNQNGVPIFDPTGKVRMIPPDQVDAALAAGGKRAVKMADPKGVHRWVQEDQVAQALQAGGQKVDDQPGLATRIQRGMDKLTTVTPEQRAGKSMATNVAQDFGAAAIGAATAPVVHPVEAAKVAWKSARPDAGLKGAAELAFGPIGAPVVHGVQGVVDELKAEPLSVAIPKLAGQAAGGYVGGEGIGEGTRLVAKIAAPAVEATTDAVKSAREKFVNSKPAQKYYPRNQSLSPQEVASQKFAKALNPPIRAVERIKGATGEVPTVKAYAARNGIKINGKLDFSKAAEGAAKEVQEHYDTKLLRPHGGEQVTVPENYNGERFSHGSNRATLNQVNDRVNQINQELKSNFRKSLASETSQAQASDAELNAEKQQLTGILHQKLADLTGLQPEDVASVRQRAGKLRTLAEEAKLSGNQDTLSLSRQDAGTSFSPSKTGIAKELYKKGQGGQEIIGNRDILDALKNFEPGKPSLPQPVPPDPATTATTPEAAQQEFLRANQTEQSAQDAAAARNAEAERLRAGNVDTQRQAAQQEAARATQGEQSSQDLAAARSRFAASRRAANTDAATTANKAAAESEVRKATELENAAQDASADRSDLASQLRDKTDAGTPPAQEDVNTRPAAAPPPSPGLIALPAPAEPTIEEKEVTPADPARGVQPVTLPVVTHPLGSVTGIDHDSGLPIVKRADPVALPAETPAAPLPAEPPSRTLPSSGKVIELPASTTPGPQSSALPAPETHVFSPELWAKANPDGDVVAAQQAAKDAGYEVEG